ncbi:MAG: aldehyde dehydrogenase family protein [Cyanobacteria bacterium NC_groundwater_1444_Ag_S-0.65um_54_12]|nr:aldehyde dehydrogenase family protein [Cyanobacteria bacterium NC_groundwater_1444_Ag_S-0.65um_54_12]
MAIETRTVITVRNPATGELIGEAPVTSKAEVYASLERARTAQLSWGAMTARERCRSLKTFRKKLVANADELSSLIMRESGKPRHEALLAEVFPLVDLMHYFARRAPQVLRPQAIRLHLAKHRRSYLHYRPKGVVGIIAPWNFPLAIAVGEAIMAIIAGNAAIIKPSEVTPLSALKAKVLWDESGLPADLFLVLPGGPDVGKALIEAKVDHVSFTGSVAAGRQVAAACGERLIPCTLELGGKAPAIVCADANLERTARALVWGAFMNSGQVCAAVERVYVMRQCHDRLVELIVAIARELRQGDPAGQEVDVGAMTFAKQLVVASEQIADALAQGAKVALGGVPVTDSGMFFPPTVLVGVTQQMRVMREETFGPLLPIMAVESEAEALSLANDSQLGLCAYVFTKEVTKGLRLAEDIAAGTVMVNDVVASHAFPETPWGGIKASGLGRTHSDLGLLDLVQVRHVNYPLIPLPRELWWYPYRETLYRLGLTLMKRFFG